MQLRYVVARLVPDLIRDEPINVGVILQSDSWVACKFIEKVPRQWGLEPDLEEDVAARLDAVWKVRLSTPSEPVYLPEVHQHREIVHTDKTFLEWLQQTFTRHLRFSEIREADIKVSDAFDFEMFLHRLYGIFVAPKPRLRQPVERSTLHTAVKRELAQLKLPFDKLIRERDVIVGTFPWPVDFVYRTDDNGSRGHEVGIGLVDLTSTRFLDKAKNLLATWVDVKNVRQDEVKTISVVGRVAPIEEHQRAIQMIKRYSDELFVFDHQKKTFLEWVADDLQLLPT